MTALTAAAVCATLWLGPRAVPPGRAGIVLTPAELSTTDWRGWSTLTAEVENSATVPVRLTVTVRNAPDTWEGGKIAQVEATVDSASRATWLIPISYWRYTYGWEWPNQPGLFRLTGWGTADPAAIARVHMATEDAAGPSGLVIHALRLVQPVGATGWVDRYGQRADRTWPGKVAADDDLLTAEQAEARRLKATRPILEFDEYRAWKTGPTRTATGFFRVEQVDGRWWFVAPNGRLWYATGMDCLVPGIDAPLAGAAHDAYAWLPLKDGQFKNAWGEIDGKPAVSFYRLNLIRKWGDHWKDGWRQRALARSAAWGFTSIGNWSTYDDKLIQSHRLPYVTQGPDTWGLKLQQASGKICDAFDPAFPGEARRTCLASLAKYRDDPWCIGHFVENEVDWEGFPRSVLGKGPDSFARRAWIERLARRYAGVAALNRLWGGSATSWNTLRWPPKPSGVAIQDAAEFRGEFADRWYAGWAEAVREADPHHLVLGSRIHGGNRFDEVVLACARHMDVVSFNHYAHGPFREEFDRLYAIAQKPFLIGEYGFNSLDAGLLTCAVPVHDQRARGVGYRFYTEQHAAIPYFVGGHWFQYLDEPVTGRFDHETAFDGFVNVADIPYPELVAAARATNPRIYAVHAGTATPFAAEPER